MSQTTQKATTTTKQRSLLHRPNLWTYVILSIGILITLFLLRGQILDALNSITSDKRVVIHQVRPERRGRSGGSHTGTGHHAQPSPESPSGQSGTQPGTAPTSSAPASGGTSTVGSAPPPATTPTPSSGGSGGNGSGSNGDNGSNGGGSGTTPSSNGNPPPPPDQPSITDPVCNLTPQACSLIPHTEIQVGDNVDVQVP
jgi:hypothetical protein